MGCCVSKQQVARTNRAAKWKTTGIVGLRDSNLKTLPNQVLDLARSVRTLDVTHNRLVDLPVEIGGLVNLQRLMASENVLQRLPSTIGKLQSLKVLALDENRLTTLPDELGLLVRLERLSVSMNALTSLPSALGSLRNLTLLNVSHNKLMLLPESLGSCYSLEELLANDNSIAELPYSICSLVHLKALGMDNNKLTQLPPLLLKECTSLQSLSIHGNPITAEELQLMDAFDEYESRRQRKFNKQLDANVMLNSKGLDEGVDLKLLNKA
ncbi:hypothetical protein KP509_20G080400 [Ceratopteris richardii]|uniref:Plant intracellular Ras-group-related LRR protein 7 n=1 Tax=Ceratopteris richardii TaxID=49495 RepID=A0A8T2SKL7_CERRI|nr:hypothetical protein KP509_20G080400 [Ceratopteris richardii]KAH7332299.1 hypothetical protein KP509_20G080400 [Ceratopteris richardii]